MSTGRQSWRAERVVKKGNKRRIVVALLSLILAALLGGLGWSFWKVSQSEPTICFISLIPPKPAPSPLALPTVPNAAGIASHAILTDLFRKFSEAHEKHVTPPLSAGTLDDLQKEFQKIGKGEKVIVYCALETAVRIDKQESSKVVVGLLAGGDTPFIEFSELLNTFTGTEASQVVLLMDLVGRRPGLANGILADDVIPLIETTVADATTDAKLPQLTVICSSGPGQRSWEYVSESLSADTSDGDEQDDKDKQSYPHFSGTAFAHFVGEAFKQGHVDTPKMLHDYLDEKISDWVQKYREEQSVVILPETASVNSPRLLREPPWLPTDFDEPEQKTPEESSEAPDSDTDAIRNKREPAASTDEWSRLLDNRKRLPKDTAAVAEREWTRLNAALVAMRLTLIHDISTSSTMDENDDPVRIMRPLSPSPADEVLPAWVETTLAGDRSLNSNSAVKETQSGEADNTAARDRANNSRLNAIVNQLRDLSRSGNPQESLTDLVRETKTLMKEWGDMSNWPHELFSLQKGLEAQLLLPTAPLELNNQKIAILETLGELIILRRRALTSAAGYINADRRMLRKVWDAQHGSAAASLAKLNAAESWLTLGPEGLPRATALIAELQKNGPKDGLAKVEAQQEQVLVRHQQRTTTPAVIQFFARQLEDVPMGPELAELASVAENSNIWADTFPEGIRSELGEELFKAMLAEVPLPTNHKDTESSATSTKQLLASYAALKQDLTTRIDNKQGTARERLQLLALPLFQSDKSLAERLMSWADVSAGIADQKNNHTGIWLAYWSIRLLMAQDNADVPVESLQKEWRELVAAVSENESSSKSNVVVLARTKLAISLQTAWQFCRFEDRSELYVSTKVAYPLLANDLAQRKKWDHSMLNRKLYEQIRGEFDGENSVPLPSASIAFADNQGPLMVSASNQVNLHPQMEGGEYLFILPPESSSGIQLTPVTASGTDVEYVAEQNNSIRLSVAVADELALKISGLTGPAQFVLALEDANELVLAQKKITIHPNYTGTKWNAQFLVQDQESKDWKIHRSRGGEIKLPPNVSGKPFKVRLVANSAGLNVNRVQVTCWSIDSKNRKLKELAVVGTNSAEGEPLTGFPIVPFNTKERGVEVRLAALPPENSKGAVLDGYDVTDGFMFQITPVTPEDSGIEVGDFPLIVMPLIADAAQYIKVPKPTYDHDTRKLTIPISSIPIRNDYAGLRREVTVSAHLSPALSALSKESSQAKTIPDPDRFEFTFDSDPFDSGRSAMMKNSFEFGISVAEIPQAFRWSLESDGQPEPIGADRLEVRANVDLTNPADVNVVDTYPHYVIGMPEKKSTEPIFNVAMYVYGFQSPRDTGSKLELKVRNQEQALAAAEAGPFVLNSPYQQKVVLRPGEEGIWNFTTSMKAYVHSELKVEKTNSNYKFGNYDLTAQLTSNDSSDEKETDINHVVKIVVDRTGPVITFAPPLKQKYRWRDLFKAKITVTDAESGIDKENELTAMLGTNDLLAQTDIAPSQYSIEFHPTELQDIKNAANLVVTATNRAGIPTTKTVTIGFVGAKKATTEKKDTGTVTVSWNDESDRKVRLRRQTNSKPHNQEGEGKGKVTFKNVPAGRYKITFQWEKTFPNWGQIAVQKVVAGDNQFTLNK